MMVKLTTSNAQIVQDHVDGNFVSVTDSLHCNWDNTKTNMMNNIGKVEQ